MGTAGLRHRIRMRGTGFVVLCDPPREWVDIAVAGLWLGGWVYWGGRTVVDIVAAWPPSPSQAAQSAVWAALCVVVAWLLAWQLAGREELEFTATELVHRCRAAGVGRTRRFRLDRVRGFRAVPREHPLLKKRTPMAPPGLGRGHGVIAFDHDGRTVQVGAGLRDADARAIVAEVTRRFPRLAEP